MVTCARLGLRAKYIGTVGDDERGRIQMDSLRASGVNIDDVQQRENCPNQSAYIVVDESTGERTILWNRPDCLAIAPEAIAPEDRLRPPAAHRRPRHRRRRTGRTHRPRPCHSCHSRCGYDLPRLRTRPAAGGLPVASAEFPRRWTGIDDPFAALTPIQGKSGMRVAAMTLGAHGALARAEGGFLYSPGFVVTVSIRPAPETCSTGPSVMLFCSKCPLPKRSNLPMPWPL